MSFDKKLPLPGICYEILNLSNGIVCIISTGVVLNFNVHLGQKGQSELSPQKFCPSSHGKTSDSQVVFFCLCVVYVSRHFIMTNCYLQHHYASADIARVQTSCIISMCIIKRSVILGKNVNSQQIKF